jgi:hypothetical protein
MNGPDWFDRFWGAVGVALAWSAFVLTSAWVIARLAEAMGR